MDIQEEILYRSVKIVHIPPRTAQGHSADLFYLEGGFPSEFVVVHGNEFIFACRTNNIMCQMFIATPASFLYSFFYQRLHEMEFSFKSYLRNLL